MYLYLKKQTEWMANLRCHRHINAILCFLEKICAYCNVSSFAHSVAYEREARRNVAHMFHSQQYGYKNDISLLHLPHYPICPYCQNGVLHRC